MKRYTRHKEEWGKFVDVKVNAPSLLNREAKRKPLGRIWISGTCDPYQPLEEKYEVTRRCLSVLLNKDWEITIQTKSHLVYRDVDLLEKLNVEVGFSIGTNDEHVKKLFEPKAPSLEERIQTLKKLHSTGITTFVMMAPLLPEPEGLIQRISGKVDYVLVDKMNYHYAAFVYEKNNLKHAMTPTFFNAKKATLSKELEKEGIPHKFLY
jgi:DNA repair photolyase